MMCRVGRLPMLLRRLLGFGLAVTMIAGVVAGRAGAEPARAGSATFGPAEIYANIPARDEYGRDQLAMFRTWNPDPLRRHEAYLKALDPRLGRVVRRAQADNTDLRFVIGSGRRTARLQRMAVAWGWSRTWASPHRFGRAVDLWPLDAQGRVLFDPGLQTRIGAAMQRAAVETGVAIRWGGAFRGFKDHDRSHFELAD